jgi:molybdate transport system substrate-binding protein
MNAQLKLSAAVVSVVAILSVSGVASAETLSVAASHTLKAAFQEIIPMFEREHGATVEVLYGPSSTLRRQIEQGAAIHVFLPETVEDVTRLERKGLTVHAKPRLYGMSPMVLVMSAASHATPISFHDPRSLRIALPDPKTSPFGQMVARALGRSHVSYTKQATMLYGEHTHELMSWVETGKADMAVVSRADAIGNGQVRIIDEIAESEGSVLQFAEAIVWTCPESTVKTAQQFLDFMASARIQRLLQKHGFDPLLSND